MSVQTFTTTRKDFDRRQLDAELRAAIGANYVVCDVITDTRVDVLFNSPPTTTEINAAQQTIDNHVPSALYEFDNLTRKLIYDPSTGLVTRIEYYASDGVSLIKTEDVTYQDGQVTSITTTWYFGTPTVFAQVTETVERDQTTGLITGVTIG